MTQKRPLVSHLARAKMCVARLRKRTGGFARPGKRHVREQSYGMAQGS